MIRVRALVVGIDTYRLSAWNVTGPAMAARGVAQWLLGLGGIELDLHVFMSKGAERDALANAQAHAPSRLTLHEEPTCSVIDDFVRRNLHENVQPDTRLFVYWSGHGSTCATTSQRVFVCSDYSERTDNRYFNASNFLQLLDTEDFTPYSSHLMFADVCGTFTLRRLIDLETYERSNGERVPQLAYFASPEGAYTQSATAGGKFTETVLDVLAQDAAYPGELESLGQRFEQAFDTISVARFRLAKWSEREKIEKVVGASPSYNPASLPFYASASDLCAQLDLDEDQVRRYYRLTADDLRVPIIPDAGSIDAVIAELCGLRDANSANMPYGLMQFMLRLAELPALSQEITPWLDREAPRQHGKRATILKQLEAEKKRRALLLVVQEQNGQIAGVRPYLCRWDGSLDMGHASSEYKTPHWDDFVAAVQACLAPFIHDEGLPNLQVEFAIDANLLDRPFHQIPAWSGGPSLGSQVSVVLRGRRRLMSPDEAWKERWRSYADKLRGQAPKQIKWIKIDPSTPLPDDRGMCFAGFALTPPGAAAGSDTRDMEVLNKLLFDGAPVLYVRHVPPEGSWQGLGNNLCALSSGATHFDAFVDIFHAQRIRGAGDAENAGLLWDDPGSNPFA